MAVGELNKLLVRQRANFACEYCGVSELDVGGELSIDHFQPQSCGGSSELDNLVYCCVRCNLYKGDFWQPHDPSFQVWNPRTSRFADHFRLAVSGELEGLSSCGEFTVKLLMLNRPQLVSRRLEKRRRQKNIAQQLELLKFLSELSHRRNELEVELQTTLLEHRDTLAQMLNQEKE